MGLCYCRVWRNLIQEGEGVVNLLLSICSTSMKVHDCLGRHAYAAVGRHVMSCQVWNLFPSS